MCSSEVGQVKYLGISEGSDPILDPASSHNITANHAPATCPRPQDAIRTRSWAGANALGIGLGDQACGVLGQRQPLGHQGVGGLPHGCRVDFSFSAAK
jgi:hypothetical protein